MRPTGCGVVSRLCYLERSNFANAKQLRSQRIPYEPALPAASKGVPARGFQKERGSHHGFPSRPWTFQTKVEDLTMANLLKYECLALMVQRLMPPQAT